MKPASIPRTCMEIHSNTSKSICPLPFMHTYIKANGSIVPCCESQEFKLNEDGASFEETWNNKKYRKLRKSLINGQHPDICRKCWKNENMGFTSNRQDAWVRYKEEGLFGICQIQVNEDMRVDIPPVFIELKCSNFCNLKCRMCHPTSSFRITEDKEIIDKYWGQNSISWPDKIQNSRKIVKEFIENKDRLLRQVQVIQFSGGEPLISHEHFNLLHELKQLNPKKLQLRYSTNLTHLDFKGIHLPSLWKDFGKVNINVSIDGIDDVYNYIRVGSDFNIIIANLKKLVDFNLTNLNLSIGFTTQAYNVFQLPEFLEFFEKWGRSPLPISTHLLYHPSFMMISIYPHEIREKIIRKFSSKQFDLNSKIRVLQSEPFDRNQWDQLIAYTEEMEKKYNISKGFHYLYEKYLKGY